MIIQNLNTTLILLFWSILSCNNSNQVTISQKAVEVNLLIDKLIPYDSLLIDGSYINVKISNNNSFPIFITSINKDTSINLIESFYFTADSFIVPPNTNTAIKEIINSHNYNDCIIKIDSNSNIIGKLTWLHYGDSNFDKKSKLIYKCTYKFYKKCLNNFPNVYNNKSIPERDSLNCKVFYQQHFYCLIEITGGAYHIQQLEISSDSMLREMRNKYL
jgi:hypothetical protein